MLKNRQQLQQPQEQELEASAGAGIAICALKRVDPNTTSSAGKKVLGGTIKRVLTLIPTLGIFTIFTTGILVSVPKPASAYCVHNLTGGRIAARDTRTSSLAFNQHDYWIRHPMEPDEKSCCPRSREECRGATVQTTGWREENGTGECLVRYDPDRGDGAMIEVRYKDRKMVCNVW